MAGKKYIIKSGQGFEGHIQPVVLSETAVYFLTTMSRYYERGSFVKTQYEIADEICAGFVNGPASDRILDDMRMLTDSLSRWDPNVADISALLFDIDPDQSS